MLQDKELLRQMCRGDKQALRLIYEKYKEDLFTVAMSLLRNVDLAEDCMSDVFVRFAGSVNNLRIHSNLKGYLVSSAVNRAKDILKKMGSHKDLDVEAIKGYEVFADPIIEVSEIEEKRRIFEALKKLPWEQQEVFVMHVQTDLKFREIAKLKKVSTKTIQSRYRYAIEKLRAILERQGDYEVREQNRKIS